MHVKPCTHQCKGSMYLSIYLSIRPRDFPTLLSPAFLIYHQWISFLKFSPLVLIYKISYETAIPHSISQPFEILLPGLTLNSGSNKLFKPLFRFEISFVDTITNIQSGENETSTRGPALARLSCNHFTHINSFNPHNSLSIQVWLFLPNVR